MKKELQLHQRLQKNILALGFEVCLIENYGLHLGYDDKEYIKN